MTRHCQSCDICQRSTPKSICGNTTLVAMPIIGEPFDTDKTNIPEGDKDLTNASYSGLGAVLLQEYDGVNMPVMSAGRSIEQKLVIQQLNASA